MTTPIPHTWFKCTCNARSCPFCDGGLSRCTTCGAVEGELLTHCPGYELSLEAREACYSGNVVDFSLLLSRREYIRKEYGVTRGDERFRETFLSRARARFAAGVERATGGGSVA